MQDWEVLTMSESALRGSPGEKEAKKEQKISKTETLAEIEPAR